MRGFRFWRRRGWRWLCWDTASCSLVDINWRFRAAFCLHRQGDTSRRENLKSHLVQCIVIVYWIFYKPLKFESGNTMRTKDETAFQCHSFNNLFKRLERPTVSWRKLEVCHPCWLTISLKEWDPWRCMQFYLFE